MTTTITGATGVNQITDDAITVAKLPTGSVLQVVSADFTSTTTTNSTSYVDSGLTATITPTSATSKILVTLTGHYYTDNTGADVRGYMSLVRGSTQIGWQLNGAYVGGNSNFTLYASGAIQKLDSPSTTNATNYKVQIKVINSGCNLNFGGDALAPTLTLMEIAG